MKKIIKGAQSLFFLFKTRKFASKITSLPYRGDKLTSMS